MKNYDVTALGELLIDFTESGISPQGNPLLEANPGGAPCNVLAMLSKLGKRTAFIGKVGAEMFGRQLAETVNEVGICTDGLVIDAGVPTTLAFVHTFAAGSAYRFDSEFQNFSLWHTFLDPCRCSGSHQICYRYCNRKRSDAFL